MMTSWKEDDNNQQAAIRRMIRATASLASRLHSETEEIAEILLRLNQLAATSGGAPNAGSAGPILRGLFERLSRLAGRHPAENEYVQQMLDEITALAEAGQVWAEPDPEPERAASAPPRQRSVKNAEYYLRRDGDTTRLVESRPGAMKDFHVTEKDFNHAIAALADVAGEEPASFQQIHDAFVQRGGSDVKSGYPLRVLLRFLRWLEPPLVERKRGRYRITQGSGEAFRNRAEKAMRQLSP
jgi:hypothetical protein